MNHWQNIKDMLRYFIITILVKWAIDLVKSGESGKLEISQAQIKLCKQWDVFIKRSGN